MTRLHILSFCEGVTLSFTDDEHNINCTIFFDEIAKNPLKDIPNLLAAKAKNMKMSFTDLLRRERSK